jgi:hypothetical protein
MTKRKPPKGHAQVGKWLAKWRPRLLLNEWHIEVVYPDSAPDSGRDGYSVLAQNSVNVAYLHMVISIYPEFFASTKDAQEATIVHELAHAIVQPAWDMVRALHAGVSCPPHIQVDTMETLTQRVANVALGRAGV